MEVGLGIHGEPGARTAPLQPASGIVEEVTSTMLLQCYPRKKRGPDPARNMPACTADLDKI